MAKIKLYPHNQETYEKINKMWETTNRVAVVQATGTGKSFLILKCLFDLPNSKKVVLAPTEYIFNQLIENSKETIPNTEFITYSKLTFMSDEEIKNLNPPLIILDEFHRCGAEQWGKGVQKLLSMFPDSKVLGTSATPIRYLDDERDMSDELFNGNVAVNLSLPEAIVKGILPMPKYVSALYTLDVEMNNLRDKVNKSSNTDESKKDLLKQIDEMKNNLDKSKGIPNILQKHLIGDNGKFIIFCKNKDHLDEMKKMVVDWFKQTKLNDKIETYSVYTGYENTDIEFEEFKNNKNNSFRLLFSIEMLNEGVHVEDISGVILLRPTVSPIIYYQQVGRAIDAGNKNKPLIFDFVYNFNNIGALKFKNDLTGMVQKECNKSEGYKQGREIVDIEEFSVYDEIFEVQELFNSIENRLVDNWDIMYDLLKEFYNKHGNCLVPKKYSIDNINLGQWIQDQRKSYKKGILSNDRVMLLDDLMFVWGTYDKKWFEKYILAKEYKEKYGELIFQDNFIYKNEYLGRWLLTQRQVYYKNKLSNSRIKLLNNIGFIFSMRKNYENCRKSNKNEKWEDMYNLLIEYKNEFDSLKMSKNLIYKNKKLGQWLMVQRTSYKNKRLSSERLNKLKSIGLSINPYKDTWDYMYNLLKDYYNEFGNYQMPHDLIYKNESLGTWVKNRKFEYRKNLLNEEKIKKLSDIGFIYP